ncbi:MAG TPA: hypothetical protein VNQ79_05735 [Blastocatellia bacterium]|nr:hypothetical protein [Blastocatellia bacterium]
MLLRKPILTFVLALLLHAGIAAQTKPTPTATSTLPDKLTAAEFDRLISEFSEPGGDFLSDNLISNETAYLYITDKLKQMNATGGAYLGVGPEQNFTYIAKVRPRIAFIVDIRRLAVTQHLMYKAIFQLAPDRAQFLSRLLSRPLAKDKSPGANATISELTDYFSRTPADEKFYAANLAEIRKLIGQEYQVRLTESDQSDLEYILKSFRQDGLEISFRLNGGWQQGYFPTLKEVIAAQDQNGRAGNFLASADDYDFVRGLHLKNLIIPVNGDFGGKRALASIGAYLRQHGLTVTAFYTSNVEQYLFDGSSFAAFASNVRKLPITEQSLFIRSVLDRYMHPAHVPGHLFTMLLQQIPVFLKDFDEGRYEYYHQLVTTHYIAAGRP